MTDDRTAPRGRSLPLSWNWQLHLGLATAAAVLLIAIMLFGRPAGWLSVVLVVLLAWGLFAANVWIRRRAQMVRDGRLLWVRRLTRWRSYDGRHVQRVDEVTTWSGICYQITQHDGTRTLLPTALFASGHSTVLAWVLDHAPDAVLDRQARRSVVHLHERGLLEHHTIAFDEDGRQLRPSGNRGTEPAAGDVEPASPDVRPGNSPNTTEQT